MMFIVVKFDSFFKYRSGEQSSVEFFTDIEDASSCAYSYTKDRKAYVDLIDVAGKKFFTVHGGQVIDEHSAEDAQQYFDEMVEFAKTAKIDVLN